MITITYTVAFLFCGDAVLLVRKLKPTWQCGCLNGIGGRREEYESTLTANEREFREETTLAGFEWRRFCVERVNSDTSVHFFSARTSDATTCGRVPPRNDVGEPLEWWDVETLLCDTLRLRHGALARGEKDPVPMIGNLRWLIPMALDWRGMTCVATASRDIKVRGSW